MIILAHPEASLRSSWPGSQSYCAWAFEKLPLFCQSTLYENIFRSLARSNNLPTDRWQITLGEEHRALAVKDPAARLSYAQAVLETDRSHGSGEPLTLSPGFFGFNDGNATKIRSGGFTARCRDAFGWLWQEDSSAE